MRRFSKQVLTPYIRDSGYRRLCEIGSSAGGNIDRLLATPGMEICCIDAGVEADLVQKYAGNPRVRVIKGLSLDAIRTLDSEFDCIMIDGDHNWYTVYHELLAIHDQRLLAKGGTIFLHDVCWPYARRDMYYDLETVPAEFRQPVAKRGMLRDQSALTADSTTGYNGHHWNAVHEGGPRNGVLTAVEDFLDKHPGYTFFKVQREWGLGVIVREGENARAVASLRRKVHLINTAEALKTALKTATGRMHHVAR
jgi:predicted O-methyltransferase YrrM